MKTEVLIPNLIKMINQKQLRKILAGKIDDYIHQKIVVENKEDLEMVGIRKYQFPSPMPACVAKNIAKGYESCRIDWKNLEK